eukprot:194251-Pleurochrysis_carterae.AAC.1
MIVIAGWDMSRLCVTNEREGPESEGEGRAAEGESLNVGSGRDLRACESVASCVGGGLVRRRACAPLSALCDDDDFLICPRLLRRQKAIARKTRQLCVREIAGSFPYEGIKFGVYDSFK